MKKLVLFFVAVIAVAVAASWCTLHWTEPRNETVSDVAAHEWLHRELALTPAQHEALEPIEAKFTVRQRQLVDDLHAAQRALAHAIADDKAYTPRVAAEVERVHHCMGELQKASIEHVFDMRAVLTREQGDKLLALAQRALEQP